jgi:hypothetical protein
MLSSDALAPKCHIRGTPSCALVEGFRVHRGECESLRNAGRSRYFAKLWARSRYLKHLEDAGVGGTPVDGVWACGHPSERRPSSPHVRCPPDRGKLMPTRGP